MILLDTDVIIEVLDKKSDKGNALMLRAIDAMIASILGTDLPFLSALSSKAADSSLSFLLYPSVGICKTK